MKRASHIDEVFAKVAFRGIGSAGDQFGGCTFTNCDFAEADLTEACFDDCDLTRASSATQT